MKKQQQEDLKMNIRKSTMEELFISSITLERSLSVVERLFQEKVVSMPSRNIFFNREKRIRNLMKSVCKESCTEYTKMEQ